MARLTRGARVARDRLDVSETALRLAVLLHAGVAPLSAWNHLGAVGGAAAEVTADIGAGRPIPAAVAARGEGWHELAAAWTVATTVGAPLADALRAFALGMRDAAEALDDIEVALAEPAGTARLMLWLPAAGILLGLALGFDTLRILFADARGLACLAVGLGLVLGARAWTAALVRRARPEPGLPGADVELFAIALSGGVSIERATDVVASTGSSTDGAMAILALSRSAGVPAVELLRAESAHARHRARTEGRIRAARLATRLLLPLGLCTLPSFLALGVAPLVIAVLASTDLPV